MIFMVMYGIVYMRVCVCIQKSMVSFVFIQWSIIECMFIGSFYKYVHS